jgi:hypothetical protein
MILLSILGCVTLDGFAFNPVHCSTVDETTCDGNEWDRICAPCEEDYDWTTDFPWFDGQLGPGQVIRPIPDAGIERLSLDTTDGEATLDAYWIPAHGEDAERATVTVFYNHGNYAGIEHYRPRLRVLHELGFNVFVWDYRGFGKSEPPGAPTAEQFLADARQMREHAATLAPDPTRIIAYGYSLGAIPAVESALHDAPCAVVLEAPFTSIQGIARSNSTANLPETFLSSGNFDNIRKIAGYDGPLLAMVGSDDTFFPPVDVRRIVDNAPGPTRYWELPGVRHGVSDRGVVEAGVPAYDAELAAFLEAEGSRCLGR